ncbi:sodium-driven multidrug efflux pump [Pyrodictium delaneyi]|uniref:Sodium-driven multidrug efflux pump n=1 Tax=Pyrodictium delaneyi TaxID=1273541 RepID=A0A0P0N1S2_9CREN|nr:MATE family efflux transporter [Pyrodictium delaneyi]ALL00221.1 sodium-driven multidrug efflux pump [Pyrodictium delaneyi]OWJ54304.1 hypothetical protein Pdsh_07405 [Pyrodictium delaneyi]
MSRDRSDDLSRLRERVLYTESLSRLLLWLAAPLIVSGSVEALYQIVDTFWLSRLGSAALGTPIVSWPYRGILGSIGFGLASSISALAGQYIGARRFDRASRVVGSVLGILLAFGIPASLVLVAGLNLYLEAMNVPADIRPLAAVYITVTVLTIPLTYIYLVFTFALGAAGNTRTPTKISIASTLTNAVLDPVLIFWANMGVLGAALATAAANALSASYAVYSFATGRHGYHIRLKDLVPEKNLLPTIARVSGPLVAQRLGTNLGFVFMVRIISGLSTPVVAAYSIGQVILNIDHVIVMPMVRATGIVVAQSLGAGMTRRSRSTVLTGGLIISGATLVYIAFLLLLRDWFISLFTTDPQVVAAARNMLTIFAPSIIGFNMFMLANVVARSSGHTVFLSLLGIARLWLFRIPLSWLLAYRLGLGDRGLWTGMALSNYVTGVLAVAWLARRDWARAVIEETKTVATPGIGGK